MNWISVEEQLPELHQFIVAFRAPWPSFYWLGFYNGIPNEKEDLFTYWLPLPNPLTKSKSGVKFTKAQEKNVLEKIAQAMHGEDARLFIKVVKRVCKIVQEEIEKEKSGGLNHMKKKYWEQRSKEYEMDQH